MEQTYVTGCTTNPLQIEVVELEQMLCDPPASMALRRLIIQWDIHSRPHEFWLYFLPTLTGRCDFAVLTTTQLK